MLKTLIYNNIVSGVLNGISFDSWSGVTSYVSNNTVVNATTGYLHNNNQALIKNNVYSGTGDGFTAGMATGSDYNISSIANDAPSPSYRTNLVTTVSFVDSANKDFHILSSDIYAKNAGTDLSADANLPFSTDIDGQTRSGFWDIGADEGPAAVYYAVGQIPPIIRPDRRSLQLHQVWPHSRWRKRRRIWAWGIRLPIMEAQCGLY